MTFTARAQLNGPDSPSVGCGHKHKTTLAASVCADATWPGVAFTVSERAPRPKHKSRATRLSEALGLLDEQPIRDHMDDVQAHIDALEALPKGDTYTGDGPPAFDARECDVADLSEVESLYDEIDQWKSGMEGTNLEQSQKYSELEDCQQALEEIKDGLEELNFSVEAPTDLNDRDAWEGYYGQLEELADAIEQVRDRDGDVTFPGMY